ncbi:MAG: LCP family protein [Actinomycetota bacterium]
MKLAVDRNRLIAGGILAVIGVAVIAWALLHGGADPTAAPAPTPTADTPPQLLSLSVRSLPVPLVAVVGTSSSGKSVAIPIPPSLLVTVPGGGDGTIAETSLRSGDALAATISNVLGAWVGAHVTTDMVGLTDIVDRAGGITLPGSPQVMSGAKVRAYLEQETGQTRFMRWGEVLQALFSKPVQLQASDLREEGELAAAQPVLSRVSDASLEELPTQPAQQRFVIADQEGITKLMSSSLGIDTTPVARVSVLNGSGVPAVGEDVAKVIIPAGFRIVSSQNAQKFGHPTTQVIAQGDEARPVAEQLHSLLGVGRVIVVAQRSGFADITLLVGEDFKPT